MDYLERAKSRYLDLRGVAGTIRSAYTQGTIAPIRHGEPAISVEEAYAIQAINRKAWEAQGRRVVGVKIGLTSPAVQQQLGVDEPDYGDLFADMDVGDHGVVPSGRLLQPKVEAEIAFILRRDINEYVEAPLDLVDAIVCAVPALEIVDSRIAGWDIAMVDTVADNASSGMFALGSETMELGGIDLAGCTMRMKRNGEVVSQGSGAACLGNPLNALRWLSAARLTRGEPLRAGDIILSGALGPMVPAHPGDRFSAEIEGVGDIAIRFAD